MITEIHYIVLRRLLYPEKTGPTKEPDVQLIYHDIVILQIALAID